MDIIVGLKYHQQANYLALTDHMAFPAVLLASKKWWDSLSPEDRDMVNQSFTKPRLTASTFKSRRKSIIWKN